ncbi:hypothetical protein LUZ61_005537 [Rhynchospora tenuis]|uniref:Uncharacterized protein n=1 Tax=Rhynchospora tenuis TaxID=198213 RepID=A0AAD6EUN1_9POAL|nr:hypothetical protein LUZ61_005537 [Rhynchospora tenuis]
MPGTDLWTEGLICAFEFVRNPNISRASSAVPIETQVSKSSTVKQQTLNKYSSLDFVPLIDLNIKEEDVNVSSKPVTGPPESQWVPIGWGRISELVQKINAGTHIDDDNINSLIENGDDLTVADVAAPYFERPAGPTWWCHVAAGHPVVDSWLRNVHWLHPAICIALRDESRLMSEKMRHLLYEVPVRVAGGLLFELLGQSVGDPERDEEDVPIVLRSWQAQNFLITSLHVKGPTTSTGVLGITEVQELLSANGSLAPKHIHEVIAYLASRLARWDDRLWRKYVFGEADEIELKFVNRL